MMVYSGSSNIAWVRIINRIGEPSVGNAIIVYDEEYNDVSDLVPETAKFMRLEPISIIAELNPSSIPRKRHYIPFRLIFNSIPSRLTNGYPA